VAQNADGRLEVFVRGSDDALWHRSQTLANSNNWSDWNSLNGVLTSSPAVFQNADGRLEVFVRGSDDALWHIWQTAANSNNWSDWNSLSGVLANRPAVFSRANGRLNVFARSTDNALWHIWQTAPNSSNWSGWTSRGSPLDQPFKGMPAVFRNVGVRSGMPFVDEGYLEVFVRGSDNALWHKRQNPWWISILYALVAIFSGGPKGDYGWTSWNSLSGVLHSSPTVFQNADGRLEVFFGGTDNALWHKWQTAPNSSKWSSWNSLGGPPEVVFTDSPVVFQNLDGRLQVFVRATSPSPDGDALLHTWQTAPNSSNWSGWHTLGGDAFVL